MVNLVADNSKLRERARRIVATLAGRDEAAAAAALDAAGGAVKPATLIAAGATPARAHDLLRETSGHLGPALAALQHDRR
jgi:N-acetylmuramic acid 6-phosphate etherase